MKPPHKEYQGKYAVFVAELPATYTRVCLALSSDSAPGYRCSVGGHVGLLIATRLGYYQALALQRRIEAARNAGV